MELPIIIVTFDGFLSSPNELKIVVPYSFRNSKHLNFSPCDHQQYIQITDYYKKDYIGSVTDIIANEKRANLCFGIGYSLGGRIMLQCLDFNNQLFDGVFFISVNPGLSDEKLKNERWEKDLEWINFLKTNSIASFIKKWNQQDVFVHTQLRKTPSFLFSKDHLIYILEKYSLSKQKNYTNFIKIAPILQCWFAGEQDVKFKQILSYLDGANLKKILISKAGHRIHLDRPRVLQYFIKSNIVNFFKKNYY